MNIENSRDYYGSAIVAGVMFPVGGNRFRMPFETVCGTRRARYGNFEMRHDVFPGGGAERADFRQSVGCC